MRDRTAGSKKLMRWVALWVKLLIGRAFMLDRLMQAKVQDAEAVGGQIEKDTATLAEIDAMLAD